MISFTLSESVRLAFVLRAASVSLKALILCRLRATDQIHDLDLNQDNQIISDLCQTLRPIRNINFMSSVTFQEALQSRLWDESIEVGLGFLTESMILKLALLAWQFNATRPEESLDELTNHLARGYNEDMWRRIHQRYEDLQGEDISFDLFIVPIRLAIPKIRRC